MEVYVREYACIQTGKTVLEAYGRYGGQYAKSSMKVDYQDYRQAFIDGVFAKLRQNVIIELRRLYRENYPIEVQTEEIRNTSQRRLRAVWSLEAAEDLRNWHGTPAATQTHHNWKKEGF